MNIKIVEYKGEEYQGYVDSPDNVIGKGDDIQFQFCLQCGQIQDKFPVEDPTWFVEKKEAEE